MSRYKLLISCLFVISLKICVSGTQFGDDNGYLFEIVSTDKDESVDSLGDEIVLYENGKICSSNSDCMYEGNCTADGTCSCPEGTNGTLCENIIECVHHPEMCGNGTDVKCDFAVKSKYAFCRCTDKKKWFNDFKERCQEPCEVRLKNGTVTKSCGLYGRCTNSFCWCIKGVSGDFCEKIDQCEELDCGKDPTATCALGVDGPYCKCNKVYQVYDKEEKICKGEPCNATKCENEGKCRDDGTCLCPEGTDGPLCKDVIGCIKNPDMCGNGTDVTCAYSNFDEGAYCKCGAGFKSFNQLTKLCSNPCEKYINNKLIKEDCGIYGRCSRSFCKCIKGVSGDRCETIDQCASGEVDCSNDPLATCSLAIDGAYCQCNKTYQVFDKGEKLCTGEPCKNNTDCLYKGSCTEDGTCFCKKGLGGPLCQRVFECEENSDMCGNGTDVKCVFNLRKKKAVCECDSEEKGFDEVDKKCKKLCEFDEDCGMYGRCDKKSFCRCLEGVSGDNCETIEKCRNFDCGIRTNCTLGSDGEAYCKCPDPHLGFDYEEKVCRACECGDHSQGCEFRDGKKNCECVLNYFRNEDKCEACKCGELSKGCELRDGIKECFCPTNYTTISGTCQKCNCGMASFHCRMEGKKTKCICYEPYKQRLDKCEFCNCGVHGKECSFSDSGEKECICKLGFKMLNTTGLCTEVCNDTNKCQNGGSCYEGLCNCPEDYAGAWCETPKWCMHSKCGNGRDEVECIWDSVKKEGRCECKKPYHLYIKDLRTCSECNCGPDGHCILTDLGEKVCICNKGYSDYLLKCKSCNCGLSSINCTFQTSGKQLCECKENYKQKTVKSYYIDDYELCLPCDCGKNGTCRFENGEKVCDCDDNHKVYNGACRECNCGRHGFCSFDRYGQKVCTCDFLYSVLDGQCQRCNCEPPDVRNIGSVCLFEETEKICHCPGGFKSPRNDFCEDINECLNASACPANTECLNLPGSYNCPCKKGFKVADPSLDPKQFGCIDINECTASPCTDSNTVCVNTLGSYDCKCKDGYYATSPTSGRYYNPKYSTCNKEETQWRSASIALGVILSIGTIGLGGYVYYQKRGFRR